MPTHFPVRNSYDCTSVAVDLDGTLAPHAVGDDLGLPDPTLVQWMGSLVASDVHVVVHSARPVAHEPMVQAWLTEHSVPHGQVALGAKPPVDLFIDDKGLAAPLPVAEDWMWWRLSGRRLAGWADGTIPGPFADEMASCWENDDAPLPPSGLLDGWRVVVPVSGGVDSTACWAMALAAGHEPLAVYVDTGARYADDEYRTVCKLASLLDTPHPERLYQEVEYQRWQHVDRGRNTVIMLTLAQQFFSQHGQWGEVWFGNLGAEWAETPLWGGDKSHHWLLRMNQLLTLDGYNVRVHSPLGSLSKADAVRWLIDHQLGDVVRHTRSCYEQGDPCLSCRSCFRRELALDAAGVGVDVHGRSVDPTLPSFAKQRRALVAALAHRPGGPDWSPARTRHLEWIAP